MEKFELHLADWQRIVFGIAPPVFLLEVFVRTVLVYLFLLLIVRELGKRMSGQLTLTEMAVMLTLGAIVSVGMQVPDRGIALSMFVLCCTLIFHRGLSWWGIKSARVEELTHGRISTLVKDGVMEIEEMRRCRISQQQLFAQLRGKGVYNLGDVRRVYLEASGLFTIIKSKSKLAGLSTFPPKDEQTKNLFDTKDGMACGNCGKVTTNTLAMNQCPKCGANAWKQALMITNK
jgi:uncharacterized membrane protein YcaP (DUF421 family)